MTRFQNLDEAANNSYSGHTLRKCMNPTILLPFMGMTTNLGEGKLRIETC